MTSFIAHKFKKEIRAYQKFEAIEKNYAYWYINRSEEIIAKGQEKQFKLVKYQEKAFKHWKNARAWRKDISSLML